MDVARPSPEFYGLVIGVSDYNSEWFANLPATVADARQLEAILKDPMLCGYPAEHVTTLIGRSATLSSMRSALVRLRNIPSSGATVVFYFSGHGVRIASGSSWEAFLCPNDVDMHNLDSTAMSGEEFSAHLAAIPAERLVVVLDSCHAGGAAQLKSREDTGRWKAGLPERFYEALSRGSGRVVIASSTESQVSYVRREGDLSLFTFHLIAALQGGAGVRGDGLIHILDVFHYVSEAVRQVTTRQTPILKADNLDWNFPVALDRGGVRASSSAPAAARIGAIRDRIIREPVAGASELSMYLGQLTSNSDRQEAVHTVWANLRQLEAERNQLSSEDWQEARNAMIFSLLLVCSRLLEDVASSVTRITAPEPASRVTISIGEINGDGNTIVQAETGVTVNVSPWSAASAPAPPLDRPHDKQR